MTAIPLLDMAAQLAAIRPELDAAIAGVLAHGRFVGGTEVDAFERAWAEHCGTRRAVGVASGTDALVLGLRAAGIGPGDEVITTAMTFVATAEAIAACGATPVLVDPELSTGLIGAAAAEAAITPRSAALLPVHLYGQTVDTDAFRELADRRGLLLIEDAAQAHGARWQGRRAGSLGDLAAFSFFPGKNLGALGDAGAVTTSDGALADRIARLRDHGRAGKYRHDELGVNARLDTLHAAVLRVKLAHLEDWNERRRAVAAIYDRRLAAVDGVEPIAVPPGVVSARHQYVVRLPERDEVLERLRARGIGAGVHYPIPLHLQPALAGVARTDGAPNAERLAREVLSLPIFPELDEARIDRVVDALAASVPAGSALA